MGLTMDTMYAALGGIKIIPDQENIANGKRILYILNYCLQIPEHYRNFLQAHRI